MFCPTCHAEFRDGFTRCESCNTALVAALPPEDHTAALQYVEVARFADSGQFALVESVLDDADVRFYVEGGQAGGVMPLLGLSRVMVAIADVDRAMTALREVNLE